MFISENINRSCAKSASVLGFHRKIFGLICLIVYLFICLITSTRPNISHFCMWCNSGLPRRLKIIASKYRHLVIFSVGKSRLRDAVSDLQSLMFSKRKKVVFFLTDYAVEKKIFPALNMFFSESVSLKSGSRGASEKDRKSESYIE